MDENTDAGQPQEPQQPYGQEPVVQPASSPWWTTPPPPAGAAAGQQGADQQGWRDDPTAAHPTVVLPRSEKQPRKLHGVRLVAVAALIAGLIGGGVGAGVTYGLTDHGGSNGRVIDALNQPNSTGGAPAADKTGTASVAQVAQHLLPSVVSITVSTGQGGDEGTGVILSSDGRILTNNHVVEAGANGGGSIAVTFNDGSTTSATILGRDPTSDLAVIKASNVSGLTVARLGDSSALVVGQQVVAIGSPFGLSGTVTSGIVSALNRPVCTANCGNANATPTVLDAIQTDAAINPGNSGGPLVDMSGAVVGINSAIRATNSVGEAGSVGVGFAIPINEARPIAQELIDNGFATHAVMGVTVGDYQGDAGTPGGAQLKAVNAGQPADKAGLKSGDVIIDFDGRRIDDADALVAAVHAAKPSSTVTITYMRGGVKHSVDMTLGSQRSS